jgi:hypothetical protein
LKRLIIFGVIASALVVLVAVAACWPRGYMGSRDIGCAAVNPGRGRQICNAISESMQWTWMGHAIIAPGYRLTWSGLRRVYCREHITPADIPALEAMQRTSLEAMTRTSDWRLQSSADELIHLVNSSNGQGTDSENSIFNPKNPEYILKHGCGSEH